MADPGFAGGAGVNCKCVGANLLFGPIFSKNFTKMRKFGPGGGETPGSMDPQMLLVEDDSLEDQSTPLTFLQLQLE